MKSLAPYYHGRMALIDLTSGHAEAMDIPREALHSGIGGPALALSVAAQYPDALIIASGPLTGSFAPASGLATATFPIQKGFAHVVLPFGHGAWLRRCGFDLMVITGSNSQHSVITCKNSTIVLTDASDLATLPDRNALRSALLRKTLSGLAGLILADAHPSPEARFPSAAGAENGPVPGAIFLGMSMASKKLLAVCLEGGYALPPVPVPLQNPLRDKISSVPGKTALQNELAHASNASAQLPAGMKAQSAACYHCPSPCRAWITPSFSRPLLVGDHAGLAAAIASCGEYAADCIAACDARGLDTAMAAPMLAGLNRDKLTETLNALTIGFPSIPPSAAVLSDAEKAGLILGICPKLIRRHSLDRNDLVRVINPALTAGLDGAVNLLTQGAYL